MSGTLNALGLPFELLWDFLAGKPVQKLAFVWLRRGIFAKSSVCVVEQSLAGAVLGRKLQKMISYENAALNERAFDLRFFWSSACSPFATPARHPFSLQIPTTQTRLFSFSALFNHTNASFRRAQPRRHAWRPPSASPHRTPPCRHAWRPSYGSYRRALPCRHAWQPPSARPRRAPPRRHAWRPSSARFRRAPPRRHAWQPPSARSCRAPPRRHAWRPPLRALSRR